MGLFDDLKNYASDNPWFDWENSPKIPDDVKDYVSEHKDDIPIDELKDLEDEVHVHIGSYCSPDDPDILNDEDLIGANVKYPKYTINENIVTLGSTAGGGSDDCDDGVTTYTFDNNGNIVGDSYEGSRSVTNPFKDLIKFIKGMFTSIKCFFVDHANIVLAGITEFKDAVANAIKNMAKKAYCTITGFIRDAYGAVIKKITTAYEFVVNTVQSVRDFLQKYTKKASKLIMGIIRRGRDIALNAYHNIQKYGKYTLYGMIILIIVVLILAIVFRFVPLDLRIAYKIPNPPVT